MIWGLPRGLGAAPGETAAPQTPQPSGSLGAHDQPSTIRAYTPSPLRHGWSSPTPRSLQGHRARRPSGTPRPRGWHRGRAPAALRGPSERHRAALPDLAPSGPGPAPLRALRARGPPSPPHRRPRAARRRSPLPARAAPLLRGAAPPGPIPEGAGPGARLPAFYCGYCGSYASTRCKAKYSNLLLLVFLKGKPKGEGWQRGEAKTGIYLFIFFKVKAKGQAWQHGEAQSQDLQQI